MILLTCTTCCNETIMSQYNNSNNNYNKCHWRWYQNSMVHNLYTAVANEKLYNHRNWKQLLSWRQRRRQGKGNLMDHCSSSSSGLLLLLPSSSSSSSLTTKIITIVQQQYSIQQLPMRFVLRQQRLLRSSSSSSSSSFLLLLLLILIMMITSQLGSSVHCFVITVGTFGTTDTLQQQHQMRNHHLELKQRHHHHHHHPIFLMMSSSSSSLPVRQRLSMDRSSTKTEATTGTSISSSLSPTAPPTTTLQQQQQRSYDNYSKNNHNYSNGYQSSKNVPYQQQDIERQISMAGRQGRTDDALQLFYSLSSVISSKSLSQPSQQPTIRQLNAVIDACARGRPVRLMTALDIFNTYTTATIVPNQPLQKVQQQQVPQVTTSTTTTTRTTIHNATTAVSSMVTKLEPNVYTYGALMNAISRLGEVDLALQVLQYMEHPNSTTTTIVRPNVVVYQSAITAAANAARPDISLQLLDDAKKNHIAITVIGYNAAITAASRANNYTLAIEILRQMQQRQVQQQNLLASGDTTTTTVLPVPDIVTYGTVMAACEHCNQWELVLQFAQEIENCTTSSSRFIDHVETEGDNTPSTSYAKNNNIYLDGMAITSALKACQQLGYASLAIHYLDRMKLLINDTNSIDTQQQRQYTTSSQTTSGRERIGSKQPLQGPDSVAYRLAISACARGGAWEDGIRLLDEYCSTVNDHDVVAYTAAITGCEYAGRWIEAVQLLIRMRQVANVQPNVVTFAAVIGACATACAQIMNDATTTNTNAGNRNNIHLNGEIPLPQKKALQILNIMKKDPNVVDPNIQVYNAAIRTCAEAMDIKRAFQLYHMLQEYEGDKIEPNVITYGTLMLACERVGSMRGMDQVFTQMRKNQIRPNEIIYGTAISCCRKAGDKDRAYTLLNKMLHDGYQPNVATINTALIAQTENMNFNNGSTKSSNTDLDRAIQIFKTFLLTSSSMTTTNATTNFTTVTTAVLPSRQTYSIMIRAFASNQRPKDAEALLRRMRTTNDGMIPDVDLYTMTVSAYERVGQPFNALRLMESMREDGYDFYDVEVLNTLFKRLVKLVNAVGQTLGSKSTGKPFDNSTPSIL